MSGQYAGDKIWKAVVAGICGSIAHSLLMYFKSWAGLLPSFQPYESLQMRLSHLIGTPIHPVVPWLLSFLNGSTFVGFIFGHLYRWLPGSVGAYRKQQFRWAKGSIQTACKLLPTVLVWLLALLPAGAAFAPTEPAPATNPDEAHSPDPDRFPRAVGREDGALAREYPRCENSGG